MVIVRSLSPRSCNGGDRGSAATRRARKYRLLRDFGNGTVCPCSYSGCTTMLDFDTVTADRIRPGAKGGHYTIDNTIPACIVCNRKRGDKSLWSYDRALARRLIRRGFVVSTRNQEA